MTEGRGRASAVAVLAALVSLAPPGTAAVPISEPGRLGAVYDRILDARFDQAAAAIEAACPPAPDVACQVFDATALWWRIQLDEHDTSLDAEFSREVDAAIAAAEAWTRREPSRAEAWFYLGGAYGARVQWRVLRAERLAAARDGKRIKTALERALELDPAMADARFGIGLYKYYAAIAPAVARFLRMLLLLPGGDRRDGLRDMQEAQARGALLRGEADYQLHWVYFWYEDQPRRGLALLEDLHARYPHNPLFAQRIGEVLVEYFHDHPASLATWQALLEAALARRVAEPAMAAARARLGIAEQLDVLYETDRAVTELETLLADPPAAPYAAVARAHVQLGAAHDRLGDRARALSAYRAALAAVPPRDPFGVRARAREGLRRAPDARAAEAYRLSLEGWRALQRGAHAEAEGLIDRALALAPLDPVALYRRARAHALRRQEEDALALLARVIAARPAAPAVVLAPAYFDRAQILEARGDRTAAVDAYRAASHVFGADGRVKMRARESADRLAHAPGSRPRR